MCSAPGPAAQRMLFGAVSWARAACRDVGIVLEVTVWAAGSLSPICMSLWHPGIVILTEQETEDAVKVGAVPLFTSFAVGVAYCFREKVKNEIQSCLLAVLNEELVEAFCSSPACSCNPP